MLCSTLSAQISGRITDPEGQPLAFVSILPNDEPGKVAVSDIEGRFKVAQTEKVRFLVFRYVGFAPLRVDSVSLFKHPGVLLEIVLKPAENALPEAIIRPGENPANILIRKAIDNRHRNNPEECLSFICNTYNKINFDLVPNRAAFDKKNSRRDSTKIETRNAIKNFASMEKAMQEHHLLSVESVTEHRFQFPNRNQERVLLNRVSGFKDMGIVAIANAVQPFAFYGDFLHILDRDFVNPISPGSINLYFFQIEDTHYSGADTIWVISFQPRKGKVFEGLEGVIHLHSNGWAIQNVRAHPAKANDNLHIKIEQSYRMVDGGRSRGLGSGRPREGSGVDSVAGPSASQWFPEQLNFELEMPKYPDATSGVRVTGHSFIDSVRIGALVRQRDFIPDMPIYIDDGATEQSSQAWEQWRSLAPLTKKEIRTYRWLDSLTRKERVGWVNQFFNYLSTGKAYLGYGLSLDLKSLIRFNQFENYRIGVGITTAEPRPLHLPKRIELGASLGYGFSDNTWKYGGYARWRINRAFQTQLEAGWRRDLQEPGALYELPKAVFVDRTLYAQRMDFSDELRVSLGSNLWPGARLETSFRQQHQHPGYNYRYGAPDAPWSRQFHFTEGSVFFRYAADEKTRKFLGEDFFVVTKIPVLEMAYTRGWKNVLGGGYNYERLVVSLHQSVFVRRLGRMNWRLEAGIATADAPLAKLFTLNQSGTNKQNLGIFVVRNTFQALPDTLFLSNRFVNLYWSQELGPVLYQTKHSSPQLTLIQNAAWGTLARPELHHDAPIRAPSKTLLESGLLIDNLIRVNYVNAATLGIGGALFYRWGGLDTGTWGKNIVPRLSLKFTFG